MQKCLVCSTQFSKKQIRKSVWLQGYKGIECDNCHHEQHVHFSTRLLIAVVCAAPVFLTRFFNITNTVFALAGYFLWIAVAIYLTPYFSKYYLKK